MAATLAGFDHTSLDVFVGLGFRAALCLVFLALFCLCCCCCCRAWFRTKNREAEREEDMQWSRNRMARAYREYPQCVRVGSGVGFCFRKSDFETFKKLILEDTDDQDFIARVVAGNQTWSQFSYEPDARATEAVQQLQKEPDEARFKSIFETLEDHDSDEDDEPTLLVKADDGLTPALYQIMKPVRPTRTPYLEVSGRAHHVDGRLLRVDDDDDDIQEETGDDDAEREEMVEVGELVYLNNFMYVEYRSHKSRKLEKDSTRTPCGTHVALRGQLSRNAWITVRSARSVFAKKHGVFYTFDRAERTTKPYPPCRGLLWYFWFLLGSQCHLWVHLTAALGFLAVSFVIFLPEQHVNKQVLFAASAVLLGGMILVTLLRGLSQWFTRYHLSRLIRSQQSTKEEAQLIKDAILSLGSTMRTLTSMGSMGHRVSESIGDGLTSARENFASLTGWGGAGSSTSANTVGKAMGA